MDPAIDDYAKYLASQGRSAIAITHNFRIVWNEGSPAIHVFFEGYDDPIYLMPEIRRRVAGGVFEVYVCRGKKIVRDVRDEIRALGSAYDSCLFFVDRDYDDILGAQIEKCDRIYITDKYAIENEVATPQFLEAILSDVVVLSRADPAFSQILSAYKKLEADFVSEISTLCAWILAARSVGLRPNLGNLNGLKSVYEIADGTIKKCPGGFEKFLKVVGVEPASVSLSSVKGWVRSIEGMGDFDLWLRGKFKSWFFRQGVICAFKEASIARSEAGAASIQIPPLIAEGRIFELAVGRVTPPASLSSFLDQRLVDM